MYKQNLHTHSTHCDGKQTPEEIITTAKAKGFDSIGFSGHSHTAYAPGYCMSPAETVEYVQHIRRLQRDCGSTFPVYCGLEFDMYSDTPTEGYDYLIGSVHYLKIGDQLYGFDRSQQAVAELIDKVFDGDGLAYAKEYYAQLAHLPEYGKFDILGHADIICKHSDNVSFFDEDSEAYRHAVTEALEALAGKIPLFEVNTGAVARGYRKTPYPLPFLLDEFKRLGFGAVVTSDCHDAPFLDCQFQESFELLKAHGFTEHYILTDNGFVPEAIV